MGKKNGKALSFVKDNLDKNEFVILSVRMDYIWVETESLRCKAVKRINKGYAYRHLCES